MSNDGLYMIKRFIKNLIPPLQWYHNLLDKNTHEQLSRKK